MKIVEKVELFSESVGAFCLHIPLRKGSQIFGVTSGVNANGEKAAFLTVYVPDLNADFEEMHIHVLPVENKFYADNVKLLGIAKFDVFNNEPDFEMAVFEIVSGDWGYNSKEYIETHGRHNIENEILSALLGLRLSKLGNKFKNENQDESSGSATNENVDFPSDLPIDEDDFRKRFGI